MSISHNWLPRAWHEAATGQTVFSNARIETAYLEASTRYEEWRTSRGQQAKVLMVARVGRYLDVASREKELVRKASWYGLGVAYITARTRLWLYLALVLLGFAFGEAAVMFEDYPGQIKKPRGLMLMDGLTEALQLALILLGVRYPSQWWVWYTVSGVSGMATSIGKACLIAEIVIPNTPIETHRDEFNAVGYACSNTVKWLYPLMARPVDRVPGLRINEPFYDLRDRGAGLNGQEREELLRVILTPPRRP